jgi:RNase P subunit RPR2
MSNDPKTRLPDEKSRWRCAHCGNLTRFDVTRASTVTEFWHADLAGVVTVEERNVGAEEVLAVSCRWCGSDDRIEIVSRPEFGEPSQEATGDGGV